MSSPFRTCETKCVLRERTGGAAAAAQTGRPYLTSRTTGRSEQLLLRAYLTAVLDTIIFLEIEWLIYFLHATAAHLLPAGTIYTTQYTLCDNTMMANSEVPARYLWLCHLTSSVFLAEDTRLLSSSRRTLSATSTRSSTRWAALRARALSLRSSTPSFQHSTYTSQTNGIV